MKDGWVRLGCFLTGWNYQILQSCTESSRKQLKKYLSAILILVILWALIGYTFSARYVKTEWLGSTVAALLFVVVIVQIERQIILTVGKAWWLRAFRGVLAVIMAIIGSAIIDQIIFKEDIEAKRIEIVNREVTKLLPERLNTINTRLQELQHEIDSLNTTNIGLYQDIDARPTIQTVSTSQMPITLKTADGRDSIAYTTTVSRTDVSNPKTKEAEVNNLNLEKLREQQDSFLQQKLNAEEELRQDLLEKQGFLEELSAMVEILKEKPIALIFYVILFVFLVFLELFVVIGKAWDNSSDYDKVVEHQLNQKLKTLNELVKA